MRRSAVGSGPVPPAERQRSSQNWPNYRYQPTSAATDRYGEVTGVTDRCREITGGYGQVQGGHRQVQRGHRGHRLCKCHRQVQIGT